MTIDSGRATSHSKICPIPRAVGLVEVFEVGVSTGCGSSLVSAI